jgi:2-dehydropantoate 2-reductase
MRIGVMGTGAVGGYFGAKLAAAGHDLVFIARGKHLEAMQREGLRVNSPGTSLHVRGGRFTADARDAGSVELILFCVKSYDTETAAETLAPMIGERTTILSLQNGIDNPEKIARRWSDERTLAGVVYVGAQITAPGVVTHSAGGKIIFGPSAGAIGKNAKAVEQALSAAGIPCELSGEIQKVQWTKLLWNAPFCAISCLTRANVKQIIESEPLTGLVLACMREVQAAALTSGIDLPDRLCEETLAFSNGLGAFKPSMLQDLEAGKPLEVDAFNGVVIELLTKSGKLAPINQSFYAMLKYLDHRLRGEASN